ncbi:MAG: hypothetical protein GX801_02450 [Fibrobacter sp.]|nr:hypothetical protein [Fibrobacter sp.]
MNIKKIIPLTLLALASTVVAGKLEIDIPARVDIQGKKVLWNNIDDPAGNNVEEWWGRGVVSLTAKSDAIDGKITVYGYPVDFGNNVVAEFVPQRDTSYLAVENYQLVTKNETLEAEVTNARYDKFVLYEAWVEHKGSFLNTKLGRYISNDRGGAFFGNYADEAPGGAFLAAGKPMNAIEINKSIYSNLAFKAALESTDDNLNKGSLRAQLKFSELASLEMFNITLTYRNNMFDFIRDSKAVAQHNATALFEVPWGMWRFWGELAFVGISGDGKIAGIPLTGGVELKGGRLFDLISLEAEWLSDRKPDATGSAKEVLGSIFVQKNIGNNFRISFGFFNNNQSSDYGMAARLTSYLN